MKLLSGFCWSCEEDDGLMVDLLRMIRESIIVSDKKELNWEERSTKLNDKDGNRSMMNTFRWIYDEKGKYEEHKHAQRAT